MRGKQILGLGAMTIMTALMVLPLGPYRGEAGETGWSYKVLAPIRRSNLTIFPVVTDRSHDTRDFLTLDEGLRSGEVVVREARRFQPLVPAPYDPFPAARRLTGWSWRTIPHVL